MNDKPSEAKPEKKRKKVTFANNASAIPVTHATSNAPTSSENVPPAPIIKKTAVRRTIQRTGSFFTTFDEVNKKRAADANSGNKDQLDIYEMDLRRQDTSDDDPPPFQLKRQRGHFRASNFYCGPPKFESFESDEKKDVDSDKIEASPPSSSTPETKPSM